MSWPSWQRRSDSGTRENSRSRTRSYKLWRADADWCCSNGRAFSELYERHSQTIYNYLFRRLADWSEAEDLTAIVFLEAFRRRREVVIVEGKVLPWLYGVATNVLRNRRRALWRQRRLLAQLEV